MFRIIASEARAQIPRTALIVIIMLVAAFALSAAAVLQVLNEYRLLGSWVNRSAGVAASEIVDLQRDIGARIIVRSTASAVLLLSTLAMLWLQQRQLAVLRMLHDVKILSLDILASMDQGVITTDRNAIITGINSAAIEILDVEDDAIGKPLLELSHGGQSLTAVAQQVSERNTAILDIDFTLRRSSRVRTIRVDAHVLRGAAGQSLGCVTLLRDVSERLQMEERVRWMEHFVSLGVLASGLHHEIKNPLTALNIHVQLLEKRLNDPNPHKPVNELMGVLKTEILRLNGVLDSFRDFTSLQRLKLQDADVDDLLQETLRLIEPQAESQQVEVFLRHSEVRIPPASLDFDKVKQAVLNLVINAIEAMPTGGKLTLEASTTEGTIFIEVADTGPGIAPEIEQDLFKPYFSTKARGTGMGLALSEKLISQHGGRIDYRTSTRGTTFRIAIPLEPAATAGT